MGRLQIDKAALAAKVGSLQADVDLAQKYMPRGEFWTLVRGMGGSEGAHFIEVFKEVAETIRSMPGDLPLGLRDRRIAHLHYFQGGTDVYVLSKGTEENPWPHGFTILNGDTWNAEYGDISLEEITSAGAELDLYWTPKPMYEVKEKHGITVSTPDELLDRENEKLAELFMGSDGYEIRKSIHDSNVKQLGEFIPLRNKLADNIRAMPRALPGGPHEEVKAYLRYTRGIYGFDVHENGGKPTTGQSWYLLSSGDEGKFRNPLCLCVDHSDPSKAHLGFIKDSEIRGAIVDINFEPTLVKEIEANLGITHLKGVTIDEFILEEVAERDNREMESGEDLEPVIGE